jgi:hypothetical protein
MGQAVASIQPNDTLATALPGAFACPRGTPSQLLYFSGEGTWEPIPVWAQCLYSAGLALARLPANGTRVCLAVAAPCRGYASAFVSAGIAAGRAETGDLRPSGQQWFERLCSLPLGTPLTLRRRNGTILRGVFHGTDLGVRDGVGKIRLLVQKQKSGGGIWFIAPDQARDLYLSSGGSTTLPARPSFEPVSCPRGFLRTFYPGDPEDYVLQTRHECRIIGRIGLLRQELLETRVGVPDVSRPVTAGTLQDLVRARNFLGEGEAFRSDLLTSSNALRAGAPIGSGPSFVVFDGAIPFLRASQFYPRAHLVAVLDRTESCFFEAVTALNQQYLYRLDDSGVIAGTAVPDGLDFMSFTEATR